MQQPTPDNLAPIYPGQPRPVAPYPVPTYPVQPQPASYPMPTYAVEPQSAPYSMPTFPGRPQPAPVVVRELTRGRSSALSVAMLLSSLVLVAGVSFAVGRLTAPPTSGSGAGAGAGLGALSGAGTGTGARRGFGAPGQVQSDQAARAAASQAPDAQAPAASAAPNGGQGGGFPNGGQGFPGGGRGFGGTPSLSGTVTAIGDAAITIQLASGQTLDVATGDSTQYHQQQPTDRSQIAVGAPVEVKVDGFGGGFPGGGQGGPAASAAPGQGQPGGGTGQLTATDVTVLQP